MKSWSPAKNIIGIRESNFGISTTALGLYLFTSATCTRPTLLPCGGLCLGVQSRDNVLTAKIRRNCLQIRGPVHAAGGHRVFQTYVVYVCAVACAVYITLATLEHRKENLLAIVGADGVCPFIFAIKLSEAVIGDLL